MSAAQSPAIRAAEAAWTQALAAPFGIGLVVTDMPKTRAALTKAKERLTQAGLDLSNYTVRTSPVNPAFELWIMRNPPKPAAA